MQLSSTSNRRSIYSNDTQIVHALHIFKIVKEKNPINWNISQLSECVLSFSYNCQYQCSEHCINKSCDRFNGSCLHGCMKDKTCTQGILIVSYNM